MMCANGLGASVHEVSDLSNAVVHMFVDTEVVFLHAQSVTETACNCAQFGFCVRWVKYFRQVFNRKLSTHGVGRSGYIMKPSLRASSAPIGSRSALCALTAID